MFRDVSNFISGLVMTNEIGSAYLSSTLYFRSELLSDPRGYLFDYFGVSISTDVSLFIVENSYRVMNLVLPYYGGEDFEDILVEFLDYETDTLVIAYE